MIKKFFKKSTAVFTAVAMLALVSLSGCGNANSGDQGIAGDSSTAVSTKSASGDSAKGPALDPVTLKWVLRIPTQNDSASVLTEVNKILKDKINATLDIQFIDAASYPEKTKLMIAASEEFDLMFTSLNFSFYENVAKQAFLPMDDLIQKYAPKAYAQIPEKFWDATKVSGKIYGFPNYQIAARQTILMLRKDIAEKYGLNMSDYKTLDQFEPAFEKIKAGEDKDKFILSPYGLNAFDIMNYMGLEGLGAEGSPGAVKIEGNDYKVINQFEDPEFIKTAKLYKNWADKGYINKDLSLVKDATELYKTGKIIASFGTYMPGVEAQINSRYGYEPVYSNLTDPYVSTASILGTMQAISKTSKNPDRTMMMLELINTDKQLFNTLAYGVENKHYKKTGENSIEQIPDSGYAPNVTWMLGNTLNAYLLPGVAADTPQKTDELNRSAKTSRFLGFTFDPEPVKTEIAQCLTISGSAQKYMMGFQFGMLDVDESLAEMNKELKAAGMDRIIAEKQKQLDAWVAANKK